MTFVELFEIIKFFGLILTIASALGVWVYGIILHFWKVKNMYNTLYDDNNGLIFKVSELEKNSILRQQQINNFISDATKKLEKLEEISDIKATLERIDERCANRGKYCENQRNNK